MKTASPTPADALGCVAYLFLMNGGRVDKTFLSDVGAALRTFDDDGDDGIDAPADGSVPVATSPAPPDAVEAPTPEVPSQHTAPVASAGALGLFDFLL